MTSSHARVIESRPCSGSLLLLLLCSETTGEARRQHAQQRSIFRVRFEYSGKDICQVLLGYVHNLGFRLKFQGLSRVMVMDLTLVTDAASSVWRTHFSMCSETQGMHNKHVRQLTIDLQKPVLSEASVNKQSLRSQPWPKSLVQYW